MLKDKTIEKIFSLARAQGLSCAELYLERSHTESLSFLGKQYKTLKSESSGANLLCDSEAGEKHFSISEIAPEALEEILGAKPEPETASPNSKIAFSKSKHPREKLFSLSRKIESLSPDFSLFYAETHRHFAVVKADGSIQTGKDEKVQFEYKVRKDGAQFEFQDYQNHIQPFWESPVLDSFLESESKERLVTPSLWPVPHGEVPLLFAHRPLAKILFRILKAVEADNLLSNESFLNYLEDSVPLAFSLEEKAENFVLDQEGESPQSLTLFDGIDFKSVATNRKLSQLLSLPKSGHGRRMNHLAAPIVSLYHSELLPKENLWLNLASLHKAILIEEVEILKYDPKTTRAKLFIPHSRLIHHGDFGEKLIGWEWEISLLELLKSLTQFSKNSCLHGFENQKGQSRLPTEISCPDALSEGLSLPGSVPPEYYWEN